MIITFKETVNGNTRSAFVPGRVIRQGDPLSLYIFIICIDIWAVIHFFWLTKESLILAFD